MDNIDQLIEQLGITMSTRFVPWRESRCRNEPRPSLNYLVTLHRPNTRDVVETDYMMGIAHVPGYKFNDKSAHYHDYLVSVAECGMYDPHWNHERQSRKTQHIAPKLKDVLYALVRDAEVADYLVYEEWADSCGYDPDSRAGEAIYNQCRKTTADLINLVGRANLACLQEAFQDY